MCSFGVKDVGGCLDLWDQHALADQTLTLLILHVGYRSERWISVNPRMTKTCFLCYLKNIFFIKGPLRSNKSNCSEHTQQSQQSDISISEHTQRGGLVKTSFPNILILKSHFETMFHHNLNFASSLCGLLKLSAGKKKTKQNNKANQKLGWS